jgi:hypothetical protein
MEKIKRIIKLEGKEFRRLIGVKKETYNKIKRFHIISQRYRNRRKRFGLRFNLIAAIYNFEL